MKKTKTFLIIAYFASFFLQACGNSENLESEKSPQNTDNNEFEYSQALKLKDSLRTTWGIDEVVIAIDLNDDGKKEEFVATSGCSAGYFYSLFTKQEGKWKLISEKEEIPNGTAPSVTILKEIHDGWHDFFTFQGSRNQSINEFTYTWNGTSYVLKAENQQKID